ncbi:MAG: PKD domain-containing protein [Reichenbachiella sp.]|uniref:PKD domain-containing protein n=1 Tax=Reichenbachiella sp. TaxID=2184521 RepID=UPI00296618F5|nr:PKD domain-containing protein [Reichenbachiella sp.]MDW3211851.1 PKD domain-containing protein [Reichenbachiella sp.]
MKNLLKNSVYLMAFLMCSLLISCGDDEGENTPIVDEPIAGFSMEKNEDNNLIVTFTSTSVGGETFSWDFGDDSELVTTENATHTYTASGTYTVTLTVSNEGGSDALEQNITVSGFGPNLVTAGDMSDASAWTLASLWGGDDNVMNHAFNDTSMVFLSSSTPPEIEGEDPTPNEYSNYMLYQEVALEGGKTYKFSADVSSTSGTTATWFEVYMLKAEPVVEDDIKYTQVALKGYGEGEDCIASPFAGDIMEIAGGCTSANAYDQMLDAEGMFTPPTDSLSTNNSIFLVFKVGSGWAPEGETAGFGDGLFLDNVEIKEAL